MANIPSDTFIEEAKELLGKIENEIIELEKNPENNEIMNSIFRALHTIKGSGSMFGFTELANFTHKSETLFDDIRKGKVKINNKIIDITLKTCDVIKLLLDNPENLKEKDIAEKNNIEKILLSLTKTDIESDEKKEIEKIQLKNLEQKINKTYRIIFNPDENIFIRGIKPEGIFNELRKLGKCYVFSHLNKSIDFNNFNPELCYTKWIIILTTSHDINSIKDAFIFVEDSCKLTIDVIDEEGIEDEETNYKKIGDILVEQGEITDTQLNEILKQKKLFGKIAIEKGITNEESLNLALEEQNIVRDIRTERKKKTETSTIRVKHEKLDELINLVGELVTLQARLTQYKNENEDSELTSITERFERLTTDLRDNSMSLRMVPLSQTFNSFHRVVRDISKNLNKSVDLTIYGSETELDKNVIDALKDPLLHIIRNSIDHGIESEKERIKTGKNKKANITIGAEYSGANVLIKIKDDGRGVDTEKIKKIAVKKNLITIDKIINEHELLSFIFKPGFTTNTEATNLSGRGVGMDVVKRNIENLRGNVEIFSKKNKGTEVLLKIPLTLAIIDGLLVKIENNFYIINLSVVEECLDISQKLKKQAKGKNIIHLRGNMIPYIDMREYFDIAGTPPEIEQIVIIQVNNVKLGIKVDKIIGQHQTVIKSTGRVYRNIEEISGATILGDGSVALIVDTNKIYKNVELENLKLSESRNE